MSIVAVAAARLITKGRLTMLTRFVTGWGALVSAFLLVGGAFAEEPQDPPGRVGRLSYIEGAVQQRTADDADWTRATLNHPVSNGFAVATQEGGRAELQVGSMAVHIGGNSELDVTALADHGTTLTLAQGEINLRLGRLASGDRIEIVTPRGIAYIVQAGGYHIDAGSTESPTRVAVFNGRAEVPRDGGPTVVTNGQAALITGDDPAGITTASAAADPLDNWARSRDRPTRSASSRTVSPEMTGGADLDQYGTWRHDSRYGEVWHPTGVPADWAPYRYGHWGWVSPWGWTWIDDQPWGFAPFHYGRWVYTAGGWVWVPGDYAEYPVYASALVGFAGSPGFVGVGFPFVSWFPLAPFEVFVPSFFVSIDFVRRINITNVNITNINISRVNGNIVINNTTNITVNNFANRNFVTTVSTSTFTSGQSINRTTITQSTTGITGTTRVSFAPTNVTAPQTVASITGWHGADAATATKPPLPTGRTAGGGSTGVGTAAMGTDTAAAGTASRDPNQRSLTPLPGSGGAQGTTTGAALPSGAKSDATSAAATSGRKLPPLPTATPPTTAATTAGGSAHAGGMSSLATSQPHQTRSATVLRGTPRGNSPSQMTAPSTMRAPAATGAFPHPPSVSGMPGGAPAHSMSMPHGFPAQPRAPMMPRGGGGQAQMRMNHG
jgi:hypothetical protein